jgi:hypothetical protein
VLCPEEAGQQRYGEERQKLQALDKAPRVRLTEAKNFS